MKPETLTRIREASAKGWPDNRISAFADKVGMSRNTISDYESGKKPIPVYAAWAFTGFAKCKKPLE